MLFFKHFIALLFMYIIHLHNKVIHVVGRDIYDNDEY